MEQEQQMTTMVDPVPAIRTSYPIMVDSRHSNASSAGLSMLMVDTPFLSFLQNGFQQEQEESKFEIADDRQLHEKTRMILLRQIRNNSKMFSRRHSLVEKAVVC